MRNTCREQMPSALLLNSDIARRIRHFVFVPKTGYPEIGAKWLPTDVAVNGIVDPLI
jgi:hypothetical protein